MVERGSHEAVVWGLIGEGGMPQNELFTAAGFLQPKSFSLLSCHASRFASKKCL